LVTSGVPDGTSKSAACFVAVSPELSAPSPNAAPNTPATATPATTTRGIFYTVLQSVGFKAKSSSRRPGLFEQRERTIATRV
jgi:hypothetical protein